MAQAATVLAAPAGAPTRRTLWVGWLLGILPSALLAMSAFMKLSRAPQVLEGFAKFGYPPASLVPIGLAEAACTVLYLVPRTAVLGAILLTGYLGGAVATHVRAGDPFLAPALLGAALWGGLFLRDPRLRALLPLRRAE